MLLTNMNSVIFNLVFKRFIHCTMFSYDLKSLISPFRIKSFWWQLKQTYTFIFSTHTTVITIQQFSSGIFPGALTCFKKEYVIFKERWFGRIFLLVFCIICCKMTKNTGEITKMLVNFPQKNTKHIFM